MKKIVLLVLSIVASTTAQYQITSQYLSHPEAMIGYVDSCARFWQNSYDPVSGGFYTNVNRMGNVITSWGTMKNSLTQSRHAYGFIRAFMMTGKEEYLVASRRAVEFMYASAWDTLYGGWYKEINAQGIPSKPFDVKTAFYQHYALLGITASCETTNDSIDWYWLQRGYDYNERTLWDTAANRIGYFDNISFDGKSPSGKSFNATVDAITTHLLHLYLMTQNEIYINRLKALAENMLDHFVQSAEQQFIGFAERYDSDWQPRSSTLEERRTIMGHVLKTAWCLGRIYQLIPEKRFLDAAEALVGMVLDRGYDHQYGGPYKDYDRLTGSMMMYGQDTAKAWWQMEQAITAGLMLYEITGNEKYIQMADETLVFFMTYFVDHTYGEVYADTKKNGSLIPAWGDHKGSDGKAAYHSIETGYYVYLYGSLFVANKPVTLYYQFPAKSYSQEITLSPLPLGKRGMKISHVTFNGSDYTSFDPISRKVAIPNGIGGIFAVTFSMDLPDHINLDSKLIPISAELEQNYPNPFNGITHIQYRIPKDGRTIVTIHDVVGRVVATLVDAWETAGIHTVKWNSYSASSGMYFYRLVTPDATITKKMLFIK